MALRYAALGSSFAAGPGIAPIADAAAMRSRRNYPHLLARLLGAELVDLTVSGATTATILDEPQATMTGAAFPPQLRSLPGTADLVTLTAGGNDLRYAGSLLVTAWRRFAPDDPITQLMDVDFPAVITAPTPADVQRTADGLAEIVERVRSAAPGARVLLVDYLTVFGDDTKPGPDIPFEPADLAVFRETQAALETAYTLAADRTGAELATVSAISRGHALGADEPWISSFTDDPLRTGASFHPTAAGMAAVATHLAHLLG